MANSKYEYVRNFEKLDILLPNAWIVIRIDGRGFHKLSAKYGFEKPNDRRALDLMNAAAVGVMKEVPDLVAGYGVSDEFSFVFHKDCTLFDRRESKIVSTIVSTFTSYYVHLWPSFFKDTPLSPPLPSFDGRAVLYPSVQNLRDYMSWRQVDCHINNLYNTTFWALIQRGGMDAKEAEKALMGTLSSDKNEILFSRFGINYNNEPEIYKKGSVVFRDYEQPAPGPGPSLPDPSSASLQTLRRESPILTPPTHPNHPHPDPSTASAATATGPASTLLAANPGTGVPAPLSKSAAERERKRRAKARIAVEHIDIIRDDFWLQRPWILSGRAGKLPKEL